MVGVHAGHINPGSRGLPVSAGFQRKTWNARV
jgi:hypothetical protein